MTGKLVVQNGNRAELVEILKQAAALVGKIPQCRLYIVNEDLSNGTHVYVYELWDDKAAHDDSLKNEQVRELIMRARPLLAAAPDGAELNAVGGHGVDF
ncbi:MAG: antibiotic biosynthesis monooxygenase [Anaerolineales bacterium]|nr:antibiotic biosynthesis monooxygenase [Anaerolineales bacterium]